MSYYTDGPRKQLPFKNWNSMRDWRISKGVSLDEIAKFLECGLSHISRVERGLEQLTEREMQKIWGGRKKEKVT